MRQFQQVAPTERQMNCKLEPLCPQCDDNECYQRAFLLVLLLICWLRRQVIWSWWLQRRESSSGDLQCLINHLHRKRRNCHLGGSAYAYAPCSDPRRILRVIVMQSSSWSRSSLVCFCTASSSFTPTEKSFMSTSRIARSDPLSPTTDTNRRPNPRNCSSSCVSFATHFRAGHHKSSSFTTQNSSRYSTSAQTSGETGVPDFLPRPLGCPLRDRFFLSSSFFHCSMHF
mmetsp:Transcript_13995/g.20477  ORF Transcript_13995/g.20477 Transcript_13995/m.20477 type:complete len:228 (+) Transcript_13995:127-810(+)